jgi:hypothetical protein
MGVVRARVASLIAGVWLFLFCGYTANAQIRPKIIVSMIATGAGGWTTVLTALAHLTVGVLICLNSSDLQSSQTFGWRGLCQRCMEISFSRSLVSRSLLMVVVLIVASVPRVR